MKKLVTIILALAMILAMSIPALAAEDTSVTINDAEGRTFVGYKLLNLTTSLKEGEHHPADCDDNHDDDCYNYAYTVNEKYRAILQKETWDNGRNELWVNGKPAAATGVSDALILEYLNGQTSNEGTIRLVANRLYRAIKAAGLTPDDEDLSAIDQGYWFFADISDLSGENDTNSLVIVDTKGQDAIVISPKTALLPTVEKKVKDIDDSEDDNIKDNPWQDTADHDIGDSVPFKLTATLPSTAMNYNSYKLVFHDTLAAGFTLKADSFRVLMYETKHKADVDTDLNDQQKDVTDSFTVKTEDLADDCTFEVSCEDVFAIEGVTKDTAFVVYYEATLNESAVFGGDGNTNEAFLEFSNDPYGTSTGKTETDKVAVYTYKLVINKTDSHQHPLAGAGFTLYKKDKSGEYKPLGTEQKGEGMTTFTWSGLDDGDYKLEESTVPAGYNKMADVYFSISAEHAENAGLTQLTSLDAGLMGEGVLATGTITKGIENHTGSALPETGAQGTFLLIFGGSVLVILATVFMITRKKMSIYED